MVDFIKLLWRDKIGFEQFLTNEKYFPDLKATFGFHTSEIEYPYRDFYGHYAVGVSEKQGYLKNSIHKDFNLRQEGVEQNYNDFSYSNFCDCINALQRDVPHLDESKLTQLEFGFNIDMEDVDVTDFINNQVLMHKYKTHDILKTFNGRGTYKQFNHSEYAVKIYDKGKQFRLDHNILRFEVRFHKSKALERLGIFKLGDLKNKYVLRLLFLELLKRFDEMMIVDDVSNLELTYQQNQWLTQFKSSEYWQFQRTRRTRMTISRNKTRCKELFGELNLNQSENLLRSKLLRKYSELMNF